MNILNQAQGRNWTIFNGDCVQVAPGLPDNSIDFSIFSPPFSTLYVYTDMKEDMGNCENHQEFFQHFDFLIPELYRILKAGRLVALHCKDLPLYMNRDGAAGLYDFPGDLIKHFEQFRFGSEFKRFVYHSRVTIWKDPVIEMQRTKNHGLLWKNFSARGEVARQGMADYLIVFRKWTNPDEMPDKQIENAPKPGEYIGQLPPVSWDNDRDYSIQVWQKYASPVWFDIDQTNVLNYQVARASEDEKHICPLQLDVIARCVQLWSNPNEVVFSPFAGIGSEGYEALLQGRRFVGIELKREYFEWARKYLEQAELRTSQVDLFAYQAQQAAAE